MILAMFAGIFAASPLIASTANNAVIRSSGTIGTISRLHVDGRYIRNSLGQTVILRGVNKVEFADDPDGTWMGSTYWSEANVKAELDAMKSWGVNVIRSHFSVELWKYDIDPDSGHPASAYCALPTREAIKRYLTFAAERGIYVILDPYTVRSYWSGGVPDPLPFPPYQRSENAEEVIASVEEFVEWWRSVAEELKDYPNVMFDLWNEPNPSMTQENWEVWLDAAQRCIEGIREKGFTGIIWFEWRTGAYCNIFAGDNSSIGYASGGFHLRTWFEDAIEYLDDPTGNLAFNVHFYRSGGSTGILQGTAMREYWNSSYAWDYDQIKMAMEHMGWKWAGEELNVPVLIGEFGANLGWRASNPTEHQNEMTGWANTLAILNEWDIHYIAFWWRTAGVFRLLEHGKPWVPPPEESGQILIDAIKSG
jgi:aryl-phospho-beta-D-glucosidase BglC (GH1 family)